jgi:hypothetical protein
MDRGRAFLPAAEEPFATSRTLQRPFAQVLAMLADEQA